MSVPSKEPDALTIALQMREAIGYLAALASKSELDKIARKLLGVHLDLGVKIQALIEQQNADAGRGAQIQFHTPLKALVKALVKALGTISPNISNSNDKGMMLYGAFSNRAKRHADVHRL